MIRLDKIVAQALDTTRSQAKKLIKKGEVVVNGKKEKNPALRIQTDEEVFYAGRKLEIFHKRYLLLNKPKGFICSNVDENSPSALNLIDLPSKDKLHFAGRLDIDTTGLVLLSDDGQWSHRVTSPNRSKSKVYHVTTDEPISSDGIDVLARGVVLKDSINPTKPCKIRRLSHTELELTLTEGRYHQVKRMIAAVGGHVTQLHRTAIGHVTLTDEMPLGHWQHLPAQEVEQF